MDDSPGQRANRTEPKQACEQLVTDARYADRATASSAWNDTDTTRSLSIQSPLGIWARSKPVKSCVSWKPVWVIPGQSDWTSTPVPCNSIEEERFGK